jgi:transcriptional regulator with XRE-family HTH domain
MKQKNADADTSRAGFGLLLRQEFLRRCRKNPSYSLRAYARQLGVDASLLSKIIRGQRNASENLVRLIAPQIGIKAADIPGILSNKKDLFYSTLDEDIFAVISDWFHFAILELMKTTSFQGEPGWIAKRLNVNRSQVEDAIERLIRLEFVEEKNGTLSLRAKNNTWANNEMTSVARKQLQLQLAAKATEAIQDVPFEIRESGSLTVACSKRLVPEVKARIQKFRKELDEFIELQNEHEEVYQLMVSFFPLTKVSNG